MKRAAQVQTVGNSPVGWALLPIRIFTVFSHKQTGRSAHSTGAANSGWRITPKSAVTLARGESFGELLGQKTTSKQDYSVKTGVLPAGFAELERLSRKSQLTETEWALSHLDPYLRFSLSLAPSLVEPVKVSRHCSLRTRTTEPLNRSDWLVQVGKSNFDWNWLRSVFEISVPRNQQAPSP